MDSSRKGQGTSNPILASSVGNANDSSVDLFASVADRMQSGMDQEVKIIRNVCHEAACEAVRSRRAKTGAGSSWSSDQNNIFLAHFNRVSERMIRMIDKVDNKIDKNVVDIARLVAEDRERIRVLERRVQDIEDGQGMTGGRIPAAQQEPGVLPQDPNQGTAPPNPASVPAGRRRRACNICGKALSIPYVYKHQKKSH